MGFESASRGSIKRLKVRSSNQSPFALINTDIDYWSQYGRKERTHPFGSLGTSINAVWYVLPAAIMFAMVM